VQAYLEDMVRKLEADVAAEGPRLHAAREKRDVLAREAKKLQLEADQIEAERETLFKQNRQSRFQTQQMAVTESEQAASSLREMEAELTQSTSEKSQADGHLKEMVAEFKHATAHHNDLMEECATEFVWMTMQTSMLRLCPGLKPYFRWQTGLLRPC